MKDIRPCFFCYQETQEWEVVGYRLHGADETEGFVCCPACRRLGKEQLEAHIQDHLVVRLANEGVVPRDLPQVQEAAKREARRCGVRFPI